MDMILGPIAVVFGKLLFLIYNSIGFHSYALALLLFTIVVKLALLPLSIKQIRSSQKMQEIQPELTKIQERYKNDKEKLNEEMQKLYAEKKYNPASGCLPLIVQMPILFALFYVIRMPMTYMLDVPKLATGEMIIMAVEAEDPAVMKSFANIEKMKKVKYEDIKDNALTVYNTYRQVDPYIEIKIIEYVNTHEGALQKVLTDAPQHITEYYDLIETDTAKRAEMDKGYAEDLAIYVKRTSRMDGFKITMWNFFNFGVQPTIDWNTIKSEPGKQIPALLLLIIAVVTTFVSSKLMMPPPKVDDKKGSGCAGQSMMWMSPLMTLWFGLTTPGGLAFYWTINNVISYAQQKFLTHHTKKEVVLTTAEYRKMGDAPLNKDQAIEVKAIEVKAIEGKANNKNLASGKPKQIGGGTKSAKNNQKGSKNR